jgi:hypothetical protein
MQSEQLSDLAAALAAAQALIPPVKRDQEARIDAIKGSYKYRYAELCSVLDAIRVPLASHGLSVTSIPVHDDHGLTLRTVLLHTSGQFLAGEFPILCDLSRPQVVGSWITYARRYSISALVGVATEDDDAATAMQQPPRRDTSDRRRIEPRNGYHRPNPDAQAIADQDQVLDTMQQQQPARRPAPRTGKELHDYVRTCKTDPALCHWIEAQWPRYPHRPSDWTDAQVMESWPLIRQHLLEVRAARNGQANGAAASAAH